MKNPITSLGHKLLIEELDKLKKIDEPKKHLEYSKGKVFINFVNVKLTFHFYFLHKIFRILTL